MRPPLAKKVILFFMQGKDTEVNERGILFLPMGNELDRVLISVLIGNLFYKAPI